MTRLEHLDLAVTSVTDVGLRHLSGLIGLKELNISNTKVTKAGVSQLQKALPNCTITHSLSNGRS
jgi:Leucine Rich repeat